MLAIKKYFGSRRRRNSAEYESAGLVCTCPHGSPRPRSPAPASPVHPLGREEGKCDLPRPRHHHNYRRSVSLGQILQRSDSSSSDVPGLFTPGAGYCRDSGGSPRPNRHAHALHQPQEAAGHELSDFERENLLFVRELDNSYHRPISHSASNTSLCSTFSEDSLTGESTPRGGSPYPGRREYPRTAHSPSKVSCSSLLRSVSREEDEDEDCENDYTFTRTTRSGGSTTGIPTTSSSSSSSCAAPVSAFRRKISMPALTGSTSDSSAPSSLNSLPGSSSAWWTNRTSRCYPVTKPLSNHSSVLSDVTKPSANHTSGLSDVTKPLTNHMTDLSDFTSPSRNHSPAIYNVTKPATSSKPPHSDVRMLFANRSFSSPAVQSGVSSGFEAANELSASSSPSWVTTFKKLATEKDTEWRDINKPATATTTTTCPVTTPTTTTTTTTTTTLSKNSSGSTTTLRHPTTTTTTTSSSSSTPPSGDVTKQGHKEEEECKGRGEKKKKKEEEEEEEEEGEEKKQYPMAFTIDISESNGQKETPSGSVKKLDIASSISKWAPKHRRNLSLTKVDEHKKVEERTTKPPLGRPRSGTVGAAAGLTGLPGRRGGGYHSEGYFSSDQDDEGPRRTELKSPRSPRTPELRSPQTPQRLVRSSSQDSAKGASLRKQQGGRSEGRACCRAEKKPTVAEVTGRTTKNKATDKMSAECRKHSSSANSLNSSHTFEMKQDNAKEEKDDVSEAGTYTIEKDSSSPEVEQARSDIDRVFGVSGTESEVEVLGGNVATPRGPQPPDEPWTSATAEQDKFKSPSSLSRSSPNWIQQWAAQVAEHTKSSELTKPPQGSPRGPRASSGNNAAATSLSSSQESSETRPRRKLPTPPTLHHTLSSGKAGNGGEALDSESPAKGRHLHKSLLDPLPGTLDDQDSSRDILRHTERLVTSLQARVDTGRVGASLRGGSFESHDSGGDSDIDTSTSYPIYDEDERLARIGSQLKARLRLVGIEGGAKTPPSASPRRPAGGSDTQEVTRAKGFRRERSNMSDGGYDGFLGRANDGSGGSDSSSDGSEQGGGGGSGGGLKDARKGIENNPPLKFNRAFSLRRARLGCEEPPQPIKPPSPIDKKKTARPSSAGSLSGNRKLPLGHSKSQGVAGLRGGAAHPQSTPTAPKSAANPPDFSRGDGGRFSLRLPRSGSTTAVSKSPSRSSTRKEGGPVGVGGSRRGAAPRSNSTLSAKEVDFQNWKRRKNYDPMKAAAEGRKKVNDKRNEKLVQGSAASTCERSPSPPGSLLRSASFHGTEGMGASAGRWPRVRPHHLYPSEDEGPYSLEEEQPHPVPHCSPLRRSPTSPHQLCSPHTTSPAHQTTSLASARARRASYALSDEGEGQVTSPTRKASLDESGSEGKRSPISSTRGLVSSRSKAKMEALDNLVISTIHSLSVKVRTTSETLLQKLKSQYDEEGDRAALLEEVLAHLSESDQALTGGGAGRSTSRELAGILRNLKKIEHALEVIDRVMICGPDDDDDDDDDDERREGGPVDWGESDY